MILSYCLVGKEVIVRLKIKGEEFLLYNIKVRIVVGLFENKKEFY